MARKATSVPFASKRHLPRFAAPPDFIRKTTLEQDAWLQIVETTDINALGFGVSFETDTPFELNGDFRYTFDFAPLEPVSGRCSLKHLRIDNLPDGRFFVRAGFAFLSQGAVKGPTGNRRFSPRVPLALDGAVARCNDPLHHGRFDLKIFDISEGGLLARIDNERITLVPNMRLPLELHLGAFGVHNILVEILHTQKRDASRGSYYLGARFQNVSPGVQAAIAFYIESAASHLEENERQFHRLVYGAVWPRVTPGEEESASDDSSRTFVLRYRNSLQSQELRLEVRDLLLEADTASEHPDRVSMGGARENTRRPMGGPERRVLHVVDASQLGDLDRKQMFFDLLFLGTLWSATHLELPEACAPLVKSFAPETSVGSGNAAQWSDFDLAQSWAAHPLVWFKACLDDRRVGRLFRLNRLRAPWWSRAFG